MHVVVHCTRSYTLTNTWTLPLTYLGKERTHSQMHTSSVCNEKENEREHEHERDRASEE